VLCDGLRFHGTFFCFNRFDERETPGSDRLYGCDRDASGGQGMEGRGSESTSIESTSSNCKMLLLPDNISAGDKGLGVCDDNTGVEESPYVVLLLVLPLSNLLASFCGS
jgi:hypothetical protein